MRKTKVEKARASQAGTWGTQHPGNIGMPKQGETSTEIFKRPRPEGSTPTEMARHPKKAQDFSRPET
jgi:hypothetical protein